MATRTLLCCAAADEAVTIIVLNAAAWAVIIGIIGPAARSLFVELPGELCVSL